MSGKISQRLLRKVHQLTALGDGIGLKLDGETIRLSLAQEDVNIQEELSTFLAGYKPFEFVADLISPPFLVDKTSDKFRIFSEDDAFEEAEVEASPRGRVRTIDPRSTLSEYRTTDRALGTFVTAAVAAESTFDVKARGVKRVMTVLDMNREVRIFTPLTTSGNWAAANRLTPANNWDDLIDGDPIADLTQLLEASSQPVTHILMNDIATHRFMAHPKVRDHIRFLVGDAGLQATLQQVSMGGGAKRFAVPGLEATIQMCPARRQVSGAQQRILGNYVVGIRAPFDGVPTDAEEIKTIQTFRKKGAAGTGFITREYFVDDVGLEGGTMVVAGHAEDVKMLTNSCGFLLTSPYT